MCCLFGLDNGVFEYRSVPSLGTGDNGFRERSSGKRTISPASENIWFGNKKNNKPYNS